MWRSSASRGNASRASAYRRAAAAGCPRRPQSSANSRSLGRVGGLVLPLEYRGKTILQGDKSLAAPELGEDVGSQLMSLREPVKAAAGRGHGLAEPPQGHERLAPCRVRQPEPRFDPEGRLVVADRLVQPVRVARGEAKAVARESVAFGVDPEGALVVDDPLVHREKAGLLLGLGSHGVVADGPLIAVVWLRPAGPGRPARRRACTRPGRTRGRSVSACRYSAIASSSPPLKARISPRL